MYGILQHEFDRNLARILKEQVEKLLSEVADLKRQNDKAQGDAIEFRRQRDEARDRLDALVGESFSERVHVVLKKRAADAEEQVVKLRRALELAKAAAYISSSTNGSRSKEQETLDRILVATCELRGFIATEHAQRLRANCGGAEYDNILKETAWIDEAMP